MALLDGEPLEQTVLVNSGGTEVGTVAAPVQTGNPAASQVDGHSASIGATTDTAAANTVIGRLKNLISLLPTALATAWFSKITDGTNVAAVKPSQVAASVTDPAMVVTISPNSHLADFNVSVFGTGITSGRQSQLSANFSTSVAMNNVSTTVSGGGTVTQASGQASITTGTATTASALVQTLGTIRYTPGREAYAMLTAAFTTPTSASSEQRAGIYDANNGFFLGFHGTTFGVTSRKAGVDTFVARGSFNSDPLDGSATSAFTRNDATEAIILTNQNVYRIRFGWLGSAPIFFEVLSPDGIWVTFHVIRQPNSSSSPSITSPNLPITMEATKTAADATSLVIGTSSWDAGVVAQLSSAQNSNLDNGNSSTTALGSGSVFTGIGFEVLGYSTIVASAFADQAGTLQVQQSQDDTNWDLVASFPVVANVATVARVSPVMRFARVVYTNGASAQGAFRLQTIEKTVETGVVDQGAPTLTANAWPVVQATVATYSVGATAFAAAAAATDIFVITGSATKTISIKRISINGIQATASNAIVQLIKRSADDTAGTFSTLTSGPYDSSDAAPTAVVRAYTANPTALGAAVMTVRTERIFIPPANLNNADAVGVEWKFGDIPRSKPIVLRGAAQILAVNMNGATFAGNAFSIDVEWTEE